MPDDFEKRYQSVWVTPPFHELADSKRVGQYYNWTLDELIAAARAGSDGICTNEHHQNACGFMPGPNLLGSVLARATNGLEGAKNTRDGKGNILCLFVAIPFCPLRSNLLERVNDLAAGGEPHPVVLLEIRDGFLQIWRTPGFAHQKWV